MKKTLTLLLVLSSIIYSQDKIKYDGKELEGKYIGHDSEIIKFHFKDSKTHSEIPFDRQRLDYIILNDGTNIDFDKPLTIVEQELPDSCRKHNLSIGMLDDRTGFSILGYTYNLKQTDMDEYFIGGGTIIMGFTATMGWQHYYRKSNLSISSVFSGIGFVHFGGTGFMPTASLTLEYNLTKSTQVKLGYFGGIHLGGTSGESGDDIGALPFAGLNFRF